MRAVRFLSLALLLVAGLAGTASAQAYNNTPGVYTDVAVGVVPAALPPGSLPSDMPALGRQKHAARGVAPDFTRH